MKFSPDGTRLATASYDDSSIIWDVATRSKVTPLNGHTAELYKLRFSRDGRLILTSSWDGTSRLWNAITGSELSKLSQRQVDRRFGGGPNGVQDTVAGSFMPGSPFNAGDKWVVTTADGGAEVFATAGGASIKRLPHNDATDAIFSFDGTRVLTFSPEKLKVWSTSNWEQLYDLNNPWPNALSSDGSQIVMGNRIPQAQGMGRNGRIIDAETGKRLRQLEGHHGVVFSVRFSPDGRYFVTAADDETAKVWDAQTGNELATLRGHAHLNVLHALFNQTASGS